MKGGFLSEIKTVGLFRLGDPLIRHILTFDGLRCGGSDIRIFGVATSSNMVCCVRGVLYIHDFYMITIAIPGYLWLCAGHNLHYSFVDSRHILKFYKHALINKISNYE